jgi:PAS domain S-box-containing protein
MTAARPDNEAQRLEALRGYGILDTSPERDFDDLALTAARICETPIALVSLVDADRQWFKARVGLSVAQTPREIAFCAHAILQRDVFVVPDTQADVRFSQNPLVTTDPYIRFYAGVPLVGDDKVALGTLCVLDRVPRQLTAEQTDALRALSRQVIAQLELRKITAALDRTAAETRAMIEALRASEEFKTRMIECSHDCIKVLDLDGQLLSMNAGGMEALEICDLGPFLHTSWIEFWQGEDRENARAAVAAARQGGVGRFVGFFPTTQTHTPLWFDVVVNAILDADGKPDRLLALSRDITQLKQAEDTLRSAHAELERKVSERTADLTQVNSALQREVIDRKEAEATLRAIVEGIESAIGDRFFYSLVQHLAAALKVQYAFVSELDREHARFRTRAVWGRGKFLDNIEIAIAGTPCEAVLNGEMSHHPDRLQQSFPADTALVDWGAVSYCGVPLCDDAGLVIGHLAILDDQPMPNGVRNLGIMRIFAVRTQAEVERLRADAALRDSEARYRDLHDGAPAAYLYFDTEGRLQSCNRQAETMLGYTTPQLRTMTFRDLAADTPYGKPLCEWMYLEFLEGRETRTEIEGRRADGSVLWVDAIVRPLRDPHGRVYSTQSILIDITARKQAEQRVRESEDRLTRVLDSAMDAIVTFDAERRIELFNDAAEKVFRCSAEQAIGERLDRFLTEAFRTVLDGALRGFAGSGQAQAYLSAGGTVSARRADGQEFPFEATISHVEVSGQPLYTLILRDIDERRRAEAELRDLNLQRAYLQEEIKSVHNFEEIVGQSRALDGALKKVQLVAATDSSVLILGETGTGKELIARAVHSSSRRKDRPLIKVNCATLPTGLIESELFGHEKGAFTGATERRIGRFELAHGGTIFLDEIGEVPLDIQVKLLRVLQEREFERVGGQQTIKVDVRIIAATNRDLTRAIADGTFRSDLYYRLNVFPIELPPLRERADDIALLVHYFVSRYATQIGRKITRVPNGAMQRLIAYPWPGNVRELENVIERAVILSAGPDLDIPAEVLPLPAASVGRVAWITAAPVSPPDGLDLEEVERRHIVSVLRQTNWRIDGAKGAATVLNLNPSTLRSRMKKLGIQRSAHANS